MTATDIASIRTILAPTGRLRAGINLGNAVLAKQAPDGALGGATVDLACEIGRRLDLPVDLVAHDGGGSVVADLGAGQLDLAFLAIDPERAETIDYSAPYVLIEGAFLVRADSPFLRPADLDAPGVRIAVGDGAAYELYLRRALKHAALIPYATSSDGLEGFHRDGLEAAANIRQPIAAFATRHAGLRVIAEPFMRISQAVALPRGRERARGWIDAVLVELRSTGFIAQALARSGEDAGLVAPQGA